ncbi:hypothetical protein MVEG_00295 [Podila verticillata NRRL 6337]|nr:hypothetical protein MVEG_00295 [Podila verticillata NRRL 6337]
MSSSIHHRTSHSNSELPSLSTRRDRAPDSPMLSPIISEATLHELDTPSDAPPTPFSQYLQPHQYLSFIFPVTLLAGSAFGVVAGNTPSYFFNKRNILNMLFVKNGWGWTSLVFLFYIGIVFGKALIQENRLIGQEPQHHRAPGADTDITGQVTSSSSSSSNETRASQDRNVAGRPSYVILKALVRWGLATLYWWLISQWFFGPSIFDRVFVLTGGFCSVDGHWSQYHCRRNSGLWSGGVDISGHMFLLTHAWLFLMEELSVFLNDPQAWANLQDRRGARYAVYTVAALCSLWWWMLLMTSVYYHHLTEKLTGLFFGVFFWFCSYVVLYKKSTFPAMPDQVVSI